MAVYIDPAVFKKPNGRKNYAHMVADSVDELHKFAATIGVKVHFFHRDKDHAHYDITEEQHAKAIEAGAKLVTSKELLRKAKQMNADGKEN